MPFKQTYGLQGLTADDRSAQEKAYLNTIQGNPAPISGADSLSISQDTTPTYNPKQAINRATDIQNAYLQNTYDELLEKYNKMYRVGSGTITNNDDIKKIADQVSSHYKKYKLNPDKLTLTNEDWKSLHARYDAIKDMYGEDKAKRFLDNQITENIKSNQGILEKASNSFMGFLSTFTGATISAVGMLNGMGNFVLGDYNKVEGLNAWDNFLNAAMDNPISRFGKDVSEYGSIFPSVIKQHKEDYATELNPHGLNQYEIVQTEEDKQKLFDISQTPFIAFQSGGYTAFSMLAGGIMAKGASVLFGALADGAVWANTASQTSRLAANTIGRSVNTAKKLDNTLDMIKKVENVTDRYIIPGLTGSLEGATEGLQTKMQVQEEGQRQLDEFYANKAHEMIQERLANPTNTKSEDELFQDVWNELGGKYNEAKNQIEYASAKAGINNFYANSLINGVLNMTLKAGLQSDRVQNALRNGKLTGWAYSKPKFNVSVTGTPGNISGIAELPKAKPTWYGRAWAIAKEPIGEGTEEYLQTLSNDVMSGAAENNIHEFIENKFSGDGTAVVGDWFGSDWGAAWNSLGKSVFSLEAAQAAVMGALSSAMGTPVLPGRRQRFNSKTGQYETTSIFNPANLVKGRDESTWDYIQRVTPWRSGVYSNYRQYMNDIKRDNDEREHLVDWLRLDENTAKFDGAVGTMKWAMDMDEKAKTNDEFGYRNSSMGKTVHDALMLLKLKDTKMGKAWMRHLQETSDMEFESEEAQKYIQHLRNDVNIDTDGKTDEELFDLLKKNALRMRTTIAAVERESKDIDSLIGNVDDDTRQSLIYSKLMLDDWKKRQPQLKGEIDDVSRQIRTSRASSSSGYSRTEKKLAARHGSLKAAVNYMARQNEMREELEKEIQAIESLGDNATDNELKALKAMKAKVKAIGKNLKEYDGLSKDAEDRVVLNEEEIMALDDVTRGRMLRLGSQRLYSSLHEDKEEFDRIDGEITDLENEKRRLKKKSVKGKARKTRDKKIKEINTKLNGLRRELKHHQGEMRQFYSDEQQAVIDNLIQQGMAIDSKFLDKVVDAGRMQASIDNFYQQRKEILTDPRAYNNYVRKARFNAQKERVRMRAKRIDKIEDYSEYASELDRMVSNASEWEKDIIRDVMSKGESGINYTDGTYGNWAKYINRRKFTESLADKIFSSEIADDMSANDLSMFYYALNYLQNEDVDLGDIDQVISKLQEKYDDGDYIFRDYVEDMNDAHPEATKTVFTSIGSVINTYKKALRLKTRDDEEAEKINREISTKGADDTGDASGETIEEAPAPREQDEKKPEEKKPEEKPKRPGIFDQAYDSPEGGQLDADENPVGTKSSWNEEVSWAFSTARKAIDNSSYTEDVKRRAMIEIDILDSSDAHYTTAEDLIDRLAWTIAIVQATADEGRDVDDLVKLLRYVRRTIGKLEDSRKPESTESNSKGGLNDIRNASSILTLDIDRIRKEYPDSWVIKVYDEYDIDGYVRRHPLNINTPIYFITDSEWDRNGDFDSSDKPVMAVVEDENGPIEIDGIKYQPIGFMPATGKADVRGSNRMGKVRNLAVNTPGQHVIMNNNGTRVVTRARGKTGARKATHPDAGTNRVNTKENNKSVKALILDTLPISEQLRLSAMPARDRLNDPVYKRAKLDFISKLSIDTNGPKERLVFKHDNLKNNEGSVSLVMDRDIGGKPVGESLSIDGETIQQAAANEDPSHITEFNTRTSRLNDSVISYIFDKIISKLDINESSPSDFKEAEKSIAEILNKKVKNFIYLTDTGLKFKAVLDEDRSNQVGNPVFNISLVNTLNSSYPAIELGSIVGGSDKRAYGKEFISKLLLDEGGNVRPFVKWQIPYEDVKILTGTSKNKDANPKFASDNLSMIIDDDIMEIAANSIQYDLHGVEMETPFNDAGDPRDFPPVVANSGNAKTNNLGTPPNAGSTARTGNGTVVDVQTGMSVDGTTPSTQRNPGLRNAKKLEQTIRENSRRFTLSKDSKYYELRELDAFGRPTGKVLKRFARVTTLIEADEEGEKFPEGSQYASPSTAIGNTVDRIVRDFFDGQFYKLSSWCSRRARSEGAETKLEEIYPNMTTTQINNLLNSLEKLQMSFVEKGIHIIPNEVTVSGTVDIVDSKGKTHHIPVAGTLDLLGYDEQGIFYIFDMKTILNYNDDKAEQRKPEWKRQLSVYRDLLKQAYGIEVDESRMKIIPFSVKYDVEHNYYKPDPKRENGLIEVNKKTKRESTFKRAFPVLKSENYNSTIPLEYVELNLVWSKLDESIQDLLKEQLPKGVDPESVQSGEKKPRRPLYEPKDLAELATHYEDDTTTSTASTEAPQVPSSEEFDYNKFSKQVKSNLRKMGVRNITAWNELTSEEQKKYLDCAKS